MLEDFLNLLAGETPDHVIWTADLSYWISGRQHYGETHYEMRMYYLPAVMAAHRVVYEGVEYDIQSVVHNEDRTETLLVCAVIE